MAHQYSSFWIIGAGQFGRKALKDLAKKYPKAIFKILDKNPRTIEIIEGVSVDFLCQEGASYLASHLDSSHSPDWIIPAVPNHLALEWIQLKMADTKTLEVIPVPADLQVLLPNPVRGRHGQFFVSYADFICPDNCIEPLERCTFTGKTRKGFLYRELEQIVFDDFCTVVIRSHQLAPGVGGYRPKALRKALHEIYACKGPVLLSTACFCHGVMHAIMVS